MPRFAEYRQHVEALMAAALAAVEPRQVVAELLQRKGRALEIGDHAFDLEGGRLFLVSVGKAAVPMAEAVVDLVGDRIHAAVIIPKKGAGVAVSPLLEEHTAITICPGDHPVPGENSLCAARTVVEMLDQTAGRDLVLCLISGGTSALLAEPLVPLQDLQQLTRLLLASGCTIHDLNTVRRQLDRLKGGGLARAAAPARCLSLILSDVVGNPLEMIGSGPTVPGKDTPEDAYRVLEHYRVREKLSPDAWERIATALEQATSQRERLLHHNDQLIVGDVRRAATAALARAVQLGFVAQFLTAHLEGEAREVGRLAAALAKDLAPDRCLILGGETTVTVRGDGVGGRNLELALAAALALEGWPACVVASFATDGEDGQAAAAGAVVSGDTARFARRCSLHGQTFLERNDSFHFFQELDGCLQLEGQGPAFNGPSPSLLQPGPTGTNVNDLLVVLAYADSG